MNEFQRDEHDKNIDWNINSIYTWMFILIQYIDMYHNGKERIKQNLKNIMHLTRF